MKKKNFGAAVVTSIFLLILCALCFAGFLCESYLLCFVPVCLLGWYLLRKLFKRSSWNKALEKVEHECDEKHSAENVAGERPDVFSLAIIIVALFLYIVSEVGSVWQSIIGGCCIEELLAQCVNIVMLFVCCIFIAVIFYNVSRRRVFDSGNPFCIYGVGATLIINAILQHNYLQTVTGQVAIYYYVPAILIIFFARMFDIAVKLKKEHDLTI